MKRLLCIVIVLFLSTSTYSFDIAFSKEKLGIAKYKISMSFLDPTTFEVTNSTLLGEVSNFRLTTGFFDRQQDFFYALVPTKGRNPWQMVVMSIKERKEIKRLSVGRYIDYRSALESHFFRVSEDGQYFVAVSRAKKKKWRLDVYTRPSHELSWSTELPKGVSGVIMLTSGVLAVTTSKEAGGKDSLSVMNVAEQKVLETHEFERGTKLVLLPSKSSGKFNLITSIKTPIKRIKNTTQLVYADAVTLNTFDAISGLKTETTKLGYEPTLVYVDKKNERGYFATRHSIKKKGLTLWSLKNAKAEMMVETDLHYNPTAVFVREDLKTATILCGKRAVIIDIEKKTVRHDFKLPMSAVSGFLNQDGNQLFFREEVGSEVGLIDVEEGIVTDHSPTGHRGEKLARVLFNVASTAVGVYTGFYIISLPIASETAMMTDKTERFLYALNHTTHDATIFKVSGFERLSVVSTKLAYQLAQYEISEFVYILGYKELTLIDPRTNTVSKTYEDGELVGISKDTGNAYYSDDEGLKIIDLATGDSKHNLVEPKEIYLVVGAE